MRLFLADIMHGNIVQNDIRFAVMEALERAGIDIPSTPRADIKPRVEKWPTDDDRIEAEAADAEAVALRRKEEAASGARRGRGARRKSRIRIEGTGCECSG